MIVMAIQHRVRDYDEWKQVFDEVPPIRFGALFQRVNRGTDDPDNLIVVTGWRSVEDAEAFKANSELADAMKRAGVISAPRFETYREVEVQEAAEV